MSPRYTDPTNPETTVEYGDDDVRRDYGERGCAEFALGFAVLVAVLVGVLIAALN